MGLGVLDLVFSGAFRDVVETFDLPFVFFTTGMLDFAVVPGTGIPERLAPNILLPLRINYIYIIENLKIKHEYLGRSKDSKTFPLNTVSLLTGLRDMKYDGYQVTLISIQKL